jgi:GNAT superfamily N-acetyltransferase
MVRRHLAQLNVATLRHPIDHPQIADFAEGLPVVNGAGEDAPGYVWRLQSDAGNATDIRVFDDPLVIVNLTVWESLEALKTFAYRGIHREFFRRRVEWFVEGSTRTALWWLRAGTLPTADDARRRLDFLDLFGPSPYAWAMGQNYPALVTERLGIDHFRDHELHRHLQEGAVPDDYECIVVAELDDAPVACGAYRRADETTAEVRRMYVAQSARGMRMGTAMLAELEAAATSNGLQRLVLESWPSQLPALERFGYQPCAGRSDIQLPAESIWLEKALTEESSRLA